MPKGLVLDDCSLCCLLNFSRLVAAGALPAGLATSTNVAVLDVHKNHLTDLPNEWVTGFTAAPETSFQQIYIHENQFAVRVTAV